MTSPNFPGYTFDRKKASMRRDQQLSYKNGLMITKPPDSGILDVQIAQTREKLDKLRTKGPEVSTSVYAPNFSPPEELKSVVLRFFAYFQESISESADEKSRVRYAKIYVFVEDETVMVEEPHERNSGMDQGVLVRRMIVDNPSNPLTHYVPSDFNVGIDIDICGVVYHIIDCDASTRLYLEGQGVYVPEREDAPEDLYSLRRKLTDRPMRVTYIDTDKTHLRDFLDYDGKVLRFNAIWDDRQRTFGELRHFYFLYFLVDGKIEIRQINPPNSGRDAYSAFLSRVALRKSPKGPLYTDADLQIGVTINVFGRNFLLIDADPFTKDFLDKRYGPHDWTPIQVGDDRQQVQTQFEYPPYNGWGDEEDSKGYCTSLTPKPPRKDIQKLLKRDGQIIRFLAKFVNPQPVDADREFVIAYYLADDTLAVFERPKRNSGFRDGKFIGKGKWKNVATGRNFEPDDLRLGETVTINSYVFQLIQADEYALNLMEAESDIFPQSNLQEIVGILRSANCADQARNAFESIDAELCGFVSEEDAKKRIMSIYRLQEHQAVTVVRRWSSNGKFDYFDFLSMIS